MCYVVKTKDFQTDNTHVYHRTDTDMHTHTYAKHTPVHTRYNTHAHTHAHIHTQVHLGLWHKHTSRDPYPEPQVA